MTGRLWVSKRVPVDVRSRLKQWISRAFLDGNADRVLLELRDLPEWMYGGQDPERIQAALVIRTGGDWQRFQGMLSLVHQDFRDLSMAANLAYGNWREQLDNVLGWTDRST